MSTLLFQHRTWLRQPAGQHCTKLFPVDSSSNSSSSSSSRRRSRRQHPTPAAASGRQRPTPAASDDDRQAQRPRQQRYALPPVYVSRADLGWGPPPWRFEQWTTTEELALHSAVPALGAPADVVATFSVEAPTGVAGLWVKGSVSAELDLRCDRCGEGYRRGVRAGLEVWLNGEAADEAELTSAEELAFPPWEDVCDLSEAVVDVLSLALPSVCLCGGQTCSRLGDEPRVVQSSPLQPRSAAASSPFAALLRAKAGKGSPPAGAKTKKGAKRREQ